MKLLKLMSLLIFCAAYLPILGLAQNPPDHPNKVFVDNAGKTYWNKKLPIYIKLFTSPEDNSGYLIKSDSTPEYANPFYLDTEGPNYIRTKWAVDKETGKTVLPKREVLWEVYADGQPPST